MRTIAGTTLSSALVSFTVLAGAVGGLRLLDGGLATAKGPVEQPVVFNHQAWMRKAARLAPTVSGASPTPTEAIDTMVKLRERGWADPARLITHRVGWDDIPDAYEMYATRSDNVIKVVMSIND